MLHTTNISVSVIIPSLNSKPYMRECLESVLSQTLRQIEILCVDAGSTDGTLEILEEYAQKDERIRLIISDKKSYGYQVNLGIQAAQGEYIGIVETDDYISPQMYQILYSYAGRENRPDFLKGRFFVFAGLGKNLCWIDPYSDLQKHDYGVIDLRNHREKGIIDLNHIWSGIYRRDFLFEKGIRLHETPGASYQDLSFSLLVGLLADTGMYLETREYFYRVDNENSSVKSASKRRCVIEEYQYTIQELKRRGVYSGDIQKLVWQQKPETYYWNASRLPETERAIFLNEIREELDAYDAKPELRSGLDEARNRFLDLLMNETKLAGRLAEDLEQKRAHNKMFRALLEQIESGGQFVLIGAGQYGQELVFFQRALGRTYIKAVADNDAGRQGKDWNQYTLLSVREAVEKNRDDFYIIANKKYAAEIQKQLEDLGICKDRMMIFQSMLTKYEIVEFLSAENRRVDC